MNAFERVKRWQAEWLALSRGRGEHWCDGIIWPTAFEIARRLDEPLGLETAPRDGSLFDIQWNGIPYLDCHFDSQGQLVQRFGKAICTQEFDTGKNCEVSWTPRPADRIMPYAKNSNGARYVP